MTIVEELSSDAMVFHQTFKRIWPASQRDALFWSHVRASEGNTYAVTNHSTMNPDYPVSFIPIYRVLTIMPINILLPTVDSEVSLTSSTKPPHWWPRRDVRVLCCWWVSPIRNNIHFVLVAHKYIWKYPIKLLNKLFQPNTSACIRLYVTVCLACRSEYPAGEQPTRDNIVTSIAYCSTGVFFNCFVVYYCVSNKLRYVWNRKKKHQLFHPNSLYTSL